MVEAAKAILLQHGEAEEAKRVRELERHIGCFFRYRNQYSEGETWWLYAAVTSVEPYRGCRGWSFQQTSLGAIEIDTAAGARPENGGWERITGREFWKAAGRISALVTKRLTRGGGQ